MRWIILAVLGLTLSAGDAMAARPGHGGDARPATAKAGAAAKPSARAAGRTAPAVTTRSAGVRGAVARGPVRAIASARATPRAPVAARGAVAYRPAIYRYTDARGSRGRPALRMVALTPQVAVRGRGSLHGRYAMRSAPMACSRHRGVTRCRPVRAVVAATPVRTGGGWSNGLAPAALFQTRACPDGTMATLARGHDDIVRCMPI